MNIETTQDIDMQPSYSYVNKKFHCHSCNRDFKKMVRSDEGAICASCNSEFVEEVTRENSSEISHFTPYVMREQPQRPQVRQPTVRIQPVEPMMTFVTRTIGPNGTIITRRITSTPSRNSAANVRPQPQGFFDSLFGFPFGGIPSGRAFNLDDIIELSMREAGNQGVPPAPEDAINKLEEVDVKEGEQCPVCMDDIKDKGTKLPCGHIFDKNCATTWLKQHDSCPVCRKSIQQNTES